MAVHLRPAESNADLQPLKAPHLSCPGDTTVGHLLQVLWYYSWSSVCQHATTAMLRSTAPCVLVHDA